jgi:excinuclease UvrABC nuclease subunit
MFQAAEELDFERAARLRDRIKELREAPELAAVGSKARNDRLSRTEEEGETGRAGPPGPSKG